MESELREQADRVISLEEEQQALKLQLEAAKKVTFDAICVRRTYSEYPLRKDLRAVASFRLDEPPVLYGKSSWG